MPEPFPGASKIVQSQIGNGVWLLIGPTGVGKSVFAKQYIWEGLLEGIPSVYVIADEPPDLSVQSMESLGFNVKPFIERGELVIVDCYSPRVGLPPASKFYANPDNLSDVSIAIEEARRNFPKMRCVMDSLTSVVVNAPPASGQRLMQLTSSRIRQSGTGILLMEAGVPDPNFMNFFRYIFDGVFEMKTEESELRHEGIFKVFSPTGVKLGILQRFFRVFSLKGVKHSTAWFPYSITDKGIVVG